jgi:hypothetical protein
VSFLKFNSFKFWGLLVLVFLFSVSVFIFFIRPDSTVSKIYNDLADCSSSFSSGVSDSDPMSQCRITVMEESFIAYGPNTPALALEALVNDYPEYWYQCHYELHRAGERLASRVDFLNYIAQVRNNTCHSGILHGVFDYIGKTAVDESPFVNVVPVCDNLYGDDTFLVFSECSHSLGHALWIHYNDFYESLPYCKLFKESSGAINCVFGLFMQAYDPINPDHNKNASTNSVSDLPNICDNWPDADTFSGCMIGAGYVYTRAYAKLETSLESSQVSQEFVDEVVKVTKELLVYCSKHTKGKDLCVNEISKQIPRSVRSKEFATPICDLLGDFSRANLCSILS